VTSIDGHNVVVQNELAYMCESSYIWQSTEEKPLDMSDFAMLHMQKFRQQQIHYKVALLSKDIWLYSKEKLHIRHVIQLNLIIKWSTLGQGTLTM